MHVRVCIGESGRYRGDGSQLVFRKVEPRREKGRLLFGRGRSWRGVDVQSGKDDDESFRANAGNPQLGEEEKTRSMNSRQLRCKAPCCSWAVL